MLGVNVESLFGVVHTVEQVFDVSWRQWDGQPADGH